MVVKIRKEDKPMTKTKFMTVPVMDFKYDSDTGEFTCYANVKNIIDHAKDRSVNGCFVKTIQRHKDNGTMPKMLWMHNPYALPVGKWVEMREDDKGLFMRGKLSKTSMGTDLEILAKDGALDSFSIGYIEIESKYNTTLKCNDLIEVDVKEVSWVNFACNEASTLHSIKTHLDEGKTLTKAELREVLSTTGLLSKRQIERVTADYNPADDIDLTEIGNLLAKSELFQ